MKKLIIVSVILLILVISYIQYQKSEIDISVKTDMESSLQDNFLTKQYLSDNTLSVTLTPHKEYTNLSLNVTSKGLNFEPLQPIDYFDLTKKRVFKFKISVNNVYKEGSIVDYSASVIDNGNHNTIIDKNFEYEVGKVRFWDKVMSIFWAFIFLIITALILGRKKLGQALELFSKLS